MVVAQGKSKAVKARHFGSGSWVYVLVCLRSAWGLAMQDIGLPGVLNKFAGRSEPSAGVGARARSAET